MITFFKHVLQFFFHKRWAVICFEWDFFQTENWDAFHYHNLSKEELQKVVVDSRQKGILFCVNQRTRHEYSLEDCPQCHHLLYHSLRGTIAKEYRQVWSTAAPNLVAVLQEYLKHGKSLYVTPKGKAILYEAGTRFLGFGPLQDVCYLAMYERATKLGLVNKERDDFAYLRTHVFSDFLQSSPEGHSMISDLLKYGMVRDGPANPGGNKSPTASS